MAVESRAVTDYSAECKMAASAESTEEKTNGEIAEQSPPKPEEEVAVDDVEQKHEDDENNIGHKLLLKQGWQAGQGLGKELQGPVDAPVVANEDLAGFGQAQEKNDEADVDSFSPKKSKTDDPDAIEEQQKKEKAREESLADLKSSFYCDLCDKQYLKHAEYDNHIDSYDHAHTQRIKELKQKESAMKLSCGKQKDDKQNEKEMRRISEFADSRVDKSSSPETQDDSDGMQVTDLTDLDLESEHLSTLSTEQKQFLFEMKKAMEFHSENPNVDMDDIPLPPPPTTIFFHGDGAEVPPLPIDVSSIPVPGPALDSIPMPDTPAPLPPSLPDSPPPPRHTAQQFLSKILQPKESSEKVEAQFQIGEDSEGDAAKNHHTIVFQNKDGVVSFGFSKKTNTLGGPSVFDSLSAKVKPIKLKKRKNPLKKKEENPLGETPKDGEASHPKEQPKEPKEELTPAEAAAEAEYYLDTPPDQARMKSGFKFVVFQKEGGATEAGQTAAQTPPAAAAGEGKPASGFLKVKSLNEDKELDWPTEMVQETTTDPKLCYCCNPLAFDFTALLKGKAKEGEKGGKDKRKSRKKRKHKKSKSLRRKEKDDGGEEKMGEGEESKDKKKKKRKRSRQSRKDGGTKEDAKKEEGAAEGEAQFEGASKDVKEEEKGKKRKRSRRRSKKEGEESGMEAGDEGDKPPDGKRKRYRKRRADSDSGSSDDGGERKKSRKKRKSRRDAEKDEKSENKECKDKERKKRKRKVTEGTDAEKKDENKKVKKEKGEKKKGETSAVPVAAQNADEETGRVSDFETTEGVAKSTDVNHAGKSKWDTSSDSELENMMQMKEKLQESMKNKKDDDEGSEKKGEEEEKKMPVEKTEKKAETKSEKIEKIEKGKVEEARVRKDSEVSETKKSHRSRRDSEYSSGERKKKSSRSRRYYDSESDYRSRSYSSDSYTSDSRYYTSDSEYSYDTYSRSRSGYDSDSYSSYSDDSYYGRHSRSRSYSRHRSRSSYSRRHRRRSYSRSYSRSYTRSRSRTRSRSYRRSRSNDRYRREMKSSPDKQFSSVLPKKEPRTYKKSESSKEPKTFEKDKLVAALPKNKDDVTQQAKELIKKVKDKKEESTPEGGKSGAIAQVPSSSEKGPVVPLIGKAPAGARRKNTLEGDRKDPVDAEVSDIPTPDDKADDIPLPPSADGQGSPGSKDDKEFIGPVLPGVDEEPTEVPLEEKFQPIGPNDPLVFKPKPVGADPNAPPVVIPPEQAEMYKKLREQAQKHAEQRRREEEGILSSDSDEEEKPAASEEATAGSQEENPELEGMEILESALISPDVAAPMEVLQGQPTLIQTPQGLVQIQPRHHLLAAQQQQQLQMQQAGIPMQQLGLMQQPQLRMVPQAGAPMIVTSHPQLFQQQMPLTTAMPGMHPSLQLQMQHAAAAQAQPQFMFQQQPQLSLRPQFVQGPFGQIIQTMPGLQQMRAAAIPQGYPVTMGGQTVLVPRLVRPGYPM